MGMLGVIEKIEIDKDSKNIIITAITDNSVTQKVDLINASGEDSVPIAQDDIAFLEKVEGINQLVALGIIAKSLGAKEGEKIIYSRKAKNNNVELMTKIYLKNDGQLSIEAVDDISIRSKEKIILNKGEDYAVKFNELDKEMKKLKEQLNNFISKEYNAHTHPHAQGPTSTPSSPSTTQITLDIKDAKSETINIP
jgi:hypothetical protein